MLRRAKEKGSNGHVPGKIETLEGMNLDFWVLQPGDQC